MNTCVCCPLPATEHHHVARGVYDPDTVVPVCGACHRILTAWQRQHGVVRRRTRTVSDHPLAPLVARLLGIGDLLRLSNLRAGGDARGWPNAVRRLITLAGCFDLDPTAPSIPPILPVRADAGRDPRLAELRRGALPWLALVFLLTRTETDDG